MRPAAKIVTISPNINVSRQVSLLWGVQSINSRDANGWKDMMSISKEIINELKIHKNLRCLVCQGQSISDSNSEFALTLKSVVKDLIDEGKTEDEIYRFLSDKYDDWILYKLKFS